MRERKGVQRTTEKIRGMRRFPQQNRAGWVAGQPREARLRTCPNACDTRLDRAMDTNVARPLDVVLDASCTVLARTDSHPGASSRTASLIRRATAAIRWAADAQLMAMISTRY